MMKKNKVLTIFIALCLLFMAVTPSAFALEDPNVVADTIVLADMESGIILYEKNMTQERSPASLTKIMTGLLAVEAIESGKITEDTIVTAPDNCQTGLDEESSTAHPAIQPGEEMRYIDVLYCALLESANEACNVLAYAVEGGISNFVDAMNLRARELGCENTHFSDTNGLTDENHYTTAYDLYLITAEAVKHPLFATIVNTEAYVVGATNMCSEQRELYNSNALMTANSVYGPGYKYDGVSGVKTGYTRKAGYCLVSTCKRNGMNILCIIMGCNGWLNTGSDDYGNFSGSRKLYDWVFGNFDYRTVIEQGTVLGEYTVELATGGEKAELKPTENIRLLLPTELSDSEIQVITEVYADKLTAPIAAGTELGRAKVVVSGQLYTDIPLYQTTDINASRGDMIKARLAEIFSHPWLKTVLFVLAAVMLLIIVLTARFKVARKRHAIEVKKAEKKRQEKMAKEEKQRYTAAQAAASWRESMPQPEEIRPVEKMDPAERKAVETDLDELIKSLGLGNDKGKER